MTLAALDAFGLSQHASFCPQPLHIQKKPRRATFRKRVFRKPTHRHNEQYVFGPLDDIIDEIKSNIWESPHDYSTEPSLLGWAAPLEVPSTWTVTPLPVSRTPSNQPLTIRKNRETRSSASGSSTGDSLFFSRSSSQDDAFHGGPVGEPAVIGTAPWPLFDAPMSCDSTDAASTTHAVGSCNYTSAQDALEHASQNGEGRSVSKRRPSRLRLFTGLSRLRRTDTRESSGSSGDTYDLTSPLSLAAHKENGLAREGLQEPGDDAVEAYVRRNARK